MGSTHDIPQGEGGEQGDPVCTRGLKSISDPLLITEKIFAFLDDTTQPCGSGVRDCPPEVTEAYQYRHPQWEDEDVESQWRETQWSRPIDGGSTSARFMCDRVEGRLGAPSFRARHESVPLGRDENATRFLEKKTEHHDTLFQQDSVGPRRPSQLVVVVLLRRHEGQLQFTQRDPRSGTFVRHLPRLEDAPLSV